MVGKLSDCAHFFPFVVDTIRGRVVSCSFLLCSLGREARSPPANFLAVSWHRGSGARDAGAGGDLTARLTRFRE